MTNVDSILKTRDITLLTKPVYSKLCFLPVVMYGCESWTKKKTENQRTDAFELWWWRRLLRVSGTARSNQSILKEVNLEYSLEPLMLKLKLQYFGHLMWRVNSLKTGKLTLILEKIEGRKRRGQRRMKWLDGIIDSMDMSLSKLQKIIKDRKPGMLQSMGSQRDGHDWATEQHIDLTVSVSLENANTLLNLIFGFLVRITWKADSTVLYT